MKNGKSLNEIAQELTRQQQAQRDFVAPTAKLEVVNANEIHVPQKGFFPITDHTHSQIASHIKMPKAYYDRVRQSSPELLDENVNHWFAKSKNERRLVRTMDGNARAFLSDRYRIFDNYKVAENALSALQAADCRVESCEVTDKRFYLKAVSNRVTHDLGLNDIVQAGIVISNSEIGSGSLRVEPLIYRLACLNGMISTDSTFRRNHVGKALGASGDRNGAIEFFSDETRRKSDEVVFMQVRDIVAGTMTDDGFASLVEKFGAAKDQKLKSDSFETVEELAKSEGLNDCESKGILSSLLSNGDSDTLFGLVNAVTDFSKHVEDYDRATDLERLGGRILETQFAS